MECFATTVEPQTKLRKAQRPKRYDAALGIPVNSAQSGPTAFLYADLGNSPGGVNGKQPLSRDTLRTLQQARRFANRSVR
jgi:hypothetical protein